MIDTKALRNKILDAAIRGKLTEQLPEDGNAEDLYNQIQEEKQKLIKEGKIKKEKSLPQITDNEIPFKIPKNWKWVRISGIALKITDGTHHSPPNGPHGDYMYISAKNIKNDGISLFDVTYVTKEIHDEIYSRCNPELGDVLLIKDGATTGVVTVNNIDTPFSLLSSVALIKLDSAYVDSWYITYILRSNLFYALVRDIMKGTGIPRITLNQIYSLIIPFPPYSEQKRIVKAVESIFSQLDIVDDLQSKLTGNSVALKNKLIELGIQGKLTEQLPEDGDAEDLYKQIQEEKQRLIKEGKIKKDKNKSYIFRRDNSHYEKQGNIERCIDDEIAFDIPENWKWVQFGNVVNIVSARRVHQSDWKSSGIPFYRAREIAKLAIDGHVDNDLYISKELYSKFSVSGVPQPGDLMVTAVGTLGKTYIVQPSDVFYYKDASVICLENRFGMDSQYLKYIMESDMLWHQITSNSAGTTVATLTMERMIEYVIPLPPLAEQKRIVDKLDQLLPLCDYLSKINT